MTSDNGAPAVMQRRNLFAGAGVTAALALTAGSSALEGFLPGRALPGVVTRLERAMGSGSANQVAVCFAEDYRVVTPHHPSRDFTGRDRVRQTWTGIFANVPDHQGRLLRWSRGTDGSTWTEWEMTGTTTAGPPYHAVGPAILTIRGGLIVSARFYVDQVEA